MELSVSSIREALRMQGICDVGFCDISDEPDSVTGALPCAMTLVIRLSDAIVEEIDGAPTHTYFHHYRTVNAALDRAMLTAGLLLQEHGFRYIPVAASQSIQGFQGRFSHKKAAVRAGLGVIGRSDLFLHREYGPRVRLGTVFTDFMPKETISRFAPLPENTLCRSCNRCVQACPAAAIHGADWTAERKVGDLLDARACSEHMKRAYQHIGRGAVCGICIAVCPAGKQ